MAGPTLTLPTPGGSLDTWGTTLNTAANQINDYDSFKRKTVDESRTSTTTLEDDDDLFTSVVANGIYLAQWDLRVDGATAGDFKYAWTGPAGATMLWTSLGHDTAGVFGAGVDGTAIGTAIAHGTLGSGTPSHIWGSGTLVVSSTAGTFRMQFAQNASSATATKALAGSWLWVRRVV
jgi:hypothetical protein